MLRLPAVASKVKEQPQPGTSKVTRFFAPPPPPSTPSPLNPPTLAQEVQVAGITFHQGPFLCSAVGGSGFDAHTLAHFAHQVCCTLLLNCFAPLSLKLFLLSVTIDDSSWCTSAIVMVIQPVEVCHIILAVMIYKQI